MTSQQTLIRQNQYIHTLKKKGFLRNLKKDLPVGTREDPFLKFRIAKVSHQTRNERVATKVLQERFRTDV
jgi:hypothetical protein